MNFSYSKCGLRGRERALQRILEILPGATSWTILIGMTLLACVKPVLAAVLLIAFSLYWFFRMLYGTIFLLLSYGRLAVEAETDWMARLREVDGLEVPGWPTTWARTISQWIARQEVRAVQHQAAPPPKSDEVFHVVILPVAKEPPEILEPGLESFVDQRFPARRILVVIAMEARAPAQVQDGARRLCDRFRGRFLDLLLIAHPDGLPGEARVKGANVTYAAKAAAGWLHDRGISWDKVVVSCFDADTVVSPHYFACLTYHFLVTPDRTRASFQPIPVYHNNIWEAPGFARVLDIGSSFFQLFESTNPEKLVTFSSHSMSFQALVDVGYWPVDMISDDSAIFWKSYLHFEGRYRVVPMYVTLSMDVVNAGSWWKTLVSVYRQKRRWAWGVENFPPVIRGFLRSTAIRRYDKIRHSFKMFEGHVAWATWSLLLGVISWLPVLLASREFSNSVMYYSAPRIQATLFHTASLPLVTTILLSICLLPKAPVKHPWLKKMGHALEWLCVPVIVIALSTLPALDAQTRLMLGTPLTFRPTEKRRAPTSTA